MSDWRGSYPCAVNVLVTYTDLSFEDAMAGLNVGHALWRARANWPGAVVSLIPGPVTEG